MEEMFLLAGQSESLALEAGRVSVLFGIGIPGLLCYLVSSYYLESIHRPKIGMCILVMANLLNVLLNAVFSWGLAGAGSYEGAAGCALGTSVVRALMFIAIAFYILTMMDKRTRGTGAGLSAVFCQAPAIFRLGWPLSVTYLIEHGTAMILVFLAGYLSTAALAEYQVAANLIQLLGLLSMGIAVASSVRIGAAIGTGELTSIKRIFQASTLVAVFCCLPFSVIFLLYQDLVLELVINNWRPVTEGVGILQIAALTLLVNGIVMVIVFSLRGQGDVKVPMLIQALSYWLIALPLAYWLAFTRNMNIAGLLIGLTTGLIFSAVALAVRFYSRQSTIPVAGARISPCH